MKAEKILKDEVLVAIKELYSVDVPAEQIVFQKTRTEFKGEFTLVTFPFIKISKKTPELTGEDIGNFIKSKSKIVEGFNVIKGFLNFELSPGFWLAFFSKTLKDKNFGIKEAVEDATSIMIEYPSPNTNKPLHLGHLRNIFLGASVAEILKANGNKVVHTCLYNDRGTNISKSMLAWSRFGKGETPESSGKKGDHLVGEYYVLFNEELKKQMKPILEEVYQSKNFERFTSEQQTKLSDLVAKREKLLSLFQTEKTTFIPEQLIAFDNEIVLVGKEVALGEKKFKELIKELERFEKQNKEQAVLLKQLKSLSGIEGKISEVEGEVNELVQNKTEIMIEVHGLTLAWENHDKEVRKLWETMNAWVYKGFEETYKSIGIKPEKFYYESDVYNLGKETVEDGLKKGVFFKKEDGSVWIDLKAEGLDDKVVLRSNGTTVYITQDIATANEKERDYKIDKSIYVVGNEQEHHFKVLFIILKKLGRTYADNLFHLSYGMVELPSGKMKSREGTVVDADDLIDEVIRQAEGTTKELGKIEGFTQEDAKHLFKTIGLAALKYFILKVDPKKKMLFNPKESLDFHGHTGPFIQASYVRTRAVIRKSERNENEFESAVINTEGWAMNAHEQQVLRILHEFPEAVSEAGKNYSPALIANYIYDLAKHYNQFYQEHYILTEPDEKIKEFRILLSWKTGLVLKKGMALLGIEVPERM